MMFLKKQNNSESMQDFLSIITYFTQSYNDENIEVTLPTILPQYTYWDQGGGVKPEDH